MASRAEQKAAARQQREAREREMQAAHARRMRLIWLGSLVAAAALAIVIVVVAVGGGSKKPSAKATKAQVTALLNGIPQHNNVLGSPSAKITLTEYGDLVCPVCRDFAVGAEEQIIRNEVRSGKVKIVYRADETASATANGGEFVAGQVAARAAGLQGLEWNFIMTWYLEQGDETTPYVTTAFINHIASQIPGLNMSQWSSNLNLQALKSQVNADGAEMNTLVATRQNGVTQNATPTLIIQGPKGTAPALQGLAPYSAFKSVFKSVS